MKNKKGFTLVELLAVIVIISILVMLAIPNVSKYVLDSRKKSFVQDARTIVSSTRDYYLSGKYELTNNVIVSGNQVKYSKDAVQDTLSKKLGVGPFNENYKDAGAVIKISQGDYGEDIYEYYVCLIDEGGNGFDYTKVDNLSTDTIQTSSGLTACGEIPKNKYTVEVVVNNGKVAADDTASKIVNEEENVSFRLQPDNSSMHGIVTCTNRQNGSINNNVLTVSNVKKNTTCSITYTLSTTVLYSDGTLIMNEKPGDRISNTNNHGLLLKEYAPFSASNMYTSRPWKDETDLIKHVTIAQKISPVSTYLWFFGMENLLTADLKNLDTSNVTRMDDMFSGCRSLKQLDLSHFDTSKVTQMQYMFRSTYSLESLDLSSFDTSKVTDMHRMFNAAGKFTSLDISNFDTSNVTNMSGMFADSQSLEHIRFGTNFNTSNVTNFSYMFGNLNNLQELDVSHFDTSKATDMSLMFSGVSKVEVLDVSHFDTSNVVNMDGLFRTCDSVKSINLSSFNTSKVENMTDMFAHMSSLTTIDVSNFDTSNVKVMSGMFLGLDNVTKIDVSNFDTSNVTNMGAQNPSVNTKSTGWTVGGMFSSCDNLKEIVFGPKFDTSKVENMSLMFAWNYRMQTLDISLFDTSNVTDMRGMFYGMYVIENIYVSNKWTTNKVTASDYMFYNSPKLPNYNSSAVDKTKAHSNTDGYLKQA